VFALGTKGRGSPGRGSHDPGERGFSAIWRPAYRVVSSLAMDFSTVNPQLFQQINASWISRIGPPVRITRIARRPVPYPEGHGRPPNVRGQNEGASGDISAGSLLVTVISSLVLGFTTLSDSTMHKCREAIGVPWEGGGELGRIDRDLMCGSCGDARTLSPLRMRCIKLIQFRDLRAVRYSPTQS
jgi:hypothetical protein